jgi:hypothetical protein
MRDIASATDPDQLYALPNVVRYSAKKGETGRLDVPCYMLNDITDVERITNHGKTLAEKAVIVNLHSSFIKEAKIKFGQEGTRSIIRKMTAHNGKLGFNWRIDAFGVGTPGYVAELGDGHFPSTYSEFIDEAIKFHTTNQALVSHLTEAKAKLGALEIPSDPTKIMGRQVV